MKVRGLARKEERSHNQPAKGDVILGHVQASPAAIGLSAITRGGGADGAGSGMGDAEMAMSALPPLQGHPRNGEAAAVDAGFTPTDR